MEKINIKNAIEQILMSLGEDITRPGLTDTPERVQKSLAELCSGYGLSPRDVIKGAIFATKSEGMIVQKNIEFYSLCEHHMLPFHGQVHVAYLPDKFIVGLSKIGRIIDVYARRLQVQENLTLEIAHAIEETLRPKGVAVIIEARHFCMMMRGVNKQHGSTTTSEYLGVFKTDLNLKTNFLEDIKR